MSSPIEIDGTERARIEMVLAQYGLDESDVESLAVLTGGLLSRVVRVQTQHDVYALKQYPEQVLGNNSLQLVCQSQVLARAEGLPVPEILSTTDAALYAESGDHFYVLSRFVEGRTYGPDAMPAWAARRMGEMLPRLQDALAGLPSGTPPAIWSHDKIEQHLDQLIAIAETRRHLTMVDDRAYRLLRQKRSLLDSIGDPPSYQPGWTHGDYHWRNVIFDRDNDVAAIIDFDTVDYFSPARDVMRCLALSFPGLGAAASEYLAGYAGASGISPVEARAFIDFYRYISTYRVWPIAPRYLDPEHYDDSWDDLIQPLPDWDWTALADQFASIAAGRF